MDPITIILLTVGAAALIGLAWMSGYDLGKSAERALANRRVNGAIASMKEVIAKENKRQPRRTARRKSK